MNNDRRVLHVLLVEDDEENLELLQQSLPTDFEGYQVEWEPCRDFDDAAHMVAIRRYDVVVTDVYRDRQGQEKGDPADEKASDVISRIKSCRFCPIVVFTDGSAPRTIAFGPFVRFADKSGGNDEILRQLREVLATGIPAIARRLHDELDRTSGSYLWDFMEAQWERLSADGLLNPSTLERLVRRRAAMQLGRLDPSAGGPTELEAVQGLEYYVYPPVSNELRLGEIVQSNQDQTIRVVLTPHCHLTIQKGDSRPRAEHVLTVKALPAKDTIVGVSSPKSPWAGSAEDKSDKLRRRTKVDAELGRPSGRYCFLPGFLDIPDLYCDLLQVESLPYETVQQEYRRVAVLDTPFAEALQSCFTRFFSAVGLPALDQDSVGHLVD